MDKFIIDIETKGQAIEKVAKFKPKFDPPGNLKDPLKIAQALIEKEKAWEKDLACNPVTGEVIAIGIKNVTTGDYTFITGTEQEILNTLWNHYETHKGALYAGHYLLTFDLPFLIRRSWILGVRVPPGIVQNFKYPEDLGFRDTIKVWQLNGYKKEDKYVTLGYLAEALGVGTKTESGEHFAEMFENDRKKAMAYLKHDLDLTEGIALKIIPDFA